VFTSSGEKALEIESDVNKGGIELVSLGVIGLDSEGLDLDLKQKELDESDNATASVEDLIQDKLRLVVAKYSFEAKKDNQLSFKKGDVIRVTMDSGKWHLGVIHYSVDAPGVVIKNTNAIPQKYPPKYMMPFTDDCEKTTEEQ